MHVLCWIAIILAWLIALAWTRVTLSALRNLPRIPTLLDPRISACLGAPQPAAPQITVIIPARNEAAAIEVTLRSLLAQTVPLAIIAIDDRSTDATGQILHRIAAEPLPPGKFLTVLHVAELPAGWMGKTHAMALAARQSATPWLLFTDADILFAPDVLERALLFAHSNAADHIAFSPTLILKTAGERLMTTVIQGFTLFTFRPWHIANPAKRDSVGVGGFNLIRAEIYRAIGGFESMRLEVIEDLRLGFLVKSLGYRQRIVFGRDLIRVHWAPGALGMARNLTKNFFAAFRFRPAALLAFVIGFVLLLCMPFAGLLAPWTLRAASLVALLMILLGHRYSARHFTGIPMYYVLTLPAGASLLAWAMLRSMFLTLLRGGVVWRGTFYPLAELRRHCGPLR
ncbi:MAG TPA: glycosyltransferase family 2 protein [Acidobacteriaceae bacterium]|jgi:glycosyltransferase involved in cell wall biosynthesis|nr:glycosyltransferase family 2 protein [Acidobacteriaceae bacterium]